MRQLLNFNGFIAHSGFIKSLVALVFVFILSCSKSDEPDFALKVIEFPNRTQDFSLWQLEPFFQETQMGYILKTDDNKIIVVDGGGTISAPYLESYLKQFGGTVHNWIITHGHQDHMGALVEILDSKSITIERLIHAPPTLEWVNKHEPVSNETYSRFLKSVEKTNTSVLVPEDQSEIVLGDGIQMEVISSRNPNIIQNAINNSSLVFKISSKSKSILFLGDMGRQGGEKILENTDVEKLKSDYVQMAHHGQHGVEKEFYEVVDADYALWPAPIWLWENRADGKGYNTGNFKTFVVREWMEELGILKNYVSGRDGTVQID